MALEARIDRTEELDTRLEEAGIPTLVYDRRWKKCRLQLVPADIKTHRVLIVDIIRMARGLPTEPFSDGAASTFLLEIPPA